MTSAEERTPLDDYRLDDRYCRSSGRVFLTGTQALVRIALMQAELDRRDGRNTAGFISGYRGSPLGALDIELWRARKFLDQNHINFLPAINEDLAATAVIGTQQVEGDSHATVDGVFSIWYGKGPGVDRAGDAMKHGNAYGSSPNGGVLVVAGDDHGCVSSSMSHQSDVAFMAWFMPTLNPANVAEYLEFGLYGFALSRFSGTWVGFKAISETVESAASIDLPELPHYKLPADFQAPPSGLHYRWPDFPGPQVEARMVSKVDAIRAFARANPIDRCIYNIPGARFGIITTGKAHFDLMESLRLLGIDEFRAREIGIDIYKVGMVWPLETEGARAFLRGKEEAMVVEEKRGIIESQLKEFLYDFPGDKPNRMVGKYDEEGNPLVPWVGELSPTLLAPLVAKRLIHEFPTLNFDAELAVIEEGRAEIPAFNGVKRLPFFCSGCPHNTSTRVPEGSQALAGIGCHFMASWMDRETSSLIQMGGEGVNWVGKSRFTGSRHIFQNLGEGTYFHSGYMAIRQAIAADTNITYKILFNDAVAMTGGQPVDGTISVPAIAQQVRAEGVQRIAVMSDAPENFDARLFPPGASFHHRDELDAVQRELREIPGVTVLIYDQACAAEKRRKRKRGTYPDPAKRIFINELVCEGCGDCSVQSNCLSIIPVETEFGRKRRIDQHTCNKDYSCVKGFCPSFVTVEGGSLRKPAALDFADELASRRAGLPEPELPHSDRVFDLLVAGVGGTGVITVGALVTMAAHLEGKGSTVLDFMGFAQKGGSVLSYVRIGPTPQSLKQVRIDRGRADTLIACDLVVGTDARALEVLARDWTHAVVNTFETPTGDFILNRNLQLESHQRLALLIDTLGTERVVVFNANSLAEALLGNPVFSNVMMLGFAWQRGLVPVTASAIERAIQLNGIAVDENLAAFNWGRVAAHDLESVRQIVHAPAEQPAPQSLDEMIARRAAFLTAYQNPAWARRYLDTVERVRQAESAVVGTAQTLTETVARYLFKLMAYKDEYEVARLYTQSDFRDQVSKVFEGDYRLKLNLAPPIMNGKRDWLGRPAKREFGPWMLTAMQWLAHGKFLRGTWLDPFGYFAERREERGLIAEYQSGLDAILENLSLQNLESGIALAALPDQVRGFGPVKAEAIATMRAERARMMAAYLDLPRTA